jgi:hypothetical protein
MSFPDMPTVCTGCEGRNLTLDHKVWLNKVAGSIEAWDEVWLSCNDCSTTLWNGQMAEFMPFLNEMRTALPTISKAVQAIIDSLAKSLAPLFERFGLISEASKASLGEPVIEPAPVFLLRIGSRVKVTNTTSSFYGRSGEVVGLGFNARYFLVQLSANDEPFDTMVFNLDELEEL